MTDVKPRGRASTDDARPAGPRFVLSEGDRQELQVQGYASIGGRLLLTQEVRDLLGDDSGVTINDVSPERQSAAQDLVARLRGESKG